MELKEQKITVSTLIQYTYRNNIMKLKPNYIFSAEDKLTDQRQIVKFKISKITENSKHLPEIFLYTSYVQSENTIRLSELYFFLFRKLGWHLNHLHIVHLCINEIFM